MLTVFAVDKTDPPNSTHNPPPVVRLPRRQGREGLELIGHVLGSCPFATFVKAGPLAAPDTSNIHDRLTQPQGQNGTTKSAPILKKASSRALWYSSRWHMSIHRLPGNLTAAHGWEPYIRFLP